MVNTFAGSGPAHAQSSLPSLPAHLQSDTHLTAHLASRYADRGSAQLV
jgi:chitin synthase